MTIYKKKETKKEKCNLSTPLKAYMKSNHLKNARYPDNSFQRKLKISHSNIYFISRVQMKSWAE
jgi:hypothetical protein